MMKEKVMTPPTPLEPVTSNDRTRPPTAVISQDQAAPSLPAPFTDQALRAGVIRDARCADGRLDPDAWFPVSAEAGKARQEAAAAIAVCTACLVRGQCLEFSLQHWDIGQHGVWGGLVAADRAKLRRRLSADYSGGHGLAVVRHEDAAVMSRVLRSLLKGRDVR
jgi:Transcription factor WhiB